MTVLERHHAARHRAIFIFGHPSRHAGLPGRVAARFPADTNECDYLYLVGDIVDGWRLSAGGTGRRRTTTWCRRSCARRARAPRSIYIPGNHDEAARQYCQLTFGGVRVEQEAIHGPPDGRKLLVIHGDQFDGIVRYATLARDPGRLGLHRGAAHQHHVQLARAASSASATGRCRPT